MSQASSFMQDSFSPEFREEALYRVCSLEVFNWGPFHGKHGCEIHEDGTAIIGPTGSGKTTLVDAMMTLLVQLPRYNLASTGGEVSDRDLISYVRGVSGAENPEDLGSHVARPGRTSTGLCINYASQYDKVCIGGIFWVDSGSNAAEDLKRFWFIGQGQENLLDQLLQMQNDEGKRQVKRFASEATGIRIYESKREYLAKVRSFFDVGDNAFTLLNRAAGLKQIYSIDQIFRELVLDDKSQFERAAEVVSEFGTLQGIYEELEIARRQRDSLVPIEKANRKLEEVRAELARLGHLRGILPVWFASIAERLWAAELDTFRKKEEDALRAKDAKTAERDRLDSQASTLEKQYMQLGGSEIQIVERDIKHAREKLDTQRRNADQYRKLIGQFDLEDDVTAEGFARNRGRLAELSKSFAESFEQARQATAGISGRLVNHREEMGRVVEELRDVEARKDSNIPFKFQTFREALAAELGQSPDDLPFLAELVEVKAEEQRWQGAIERAIGSERLRVLVPAGLMSRALDWVNSRHNKVHVRLQQADANPSVARGFDDGFVRKLNFKEHPFADNARSLLARRDRHCVESVEALRRTEHAMTVEGTMSDKDGRFEKQDQRALDADWMTGFNNAQLLKTLTKRYTDLAETVAGLEQAEKAHIREEGAIDQKVRLVGRLNEMEFAEIDTGLLEEELARLDAKIKALMDPDSDMAKTREQLEAVRKQVAECGRVLDKLNESLGAIRAGGRQAEEQHEIARQQKGAGLNEEDAGLAEKEFGGLDGVNVRQLSVAQDRAVKGVAGRIAGLDEKRSELERSMTSLMVKARQVDTGALAEVGEDLRDVPEYLARLKTLLEEALPEKLDRFRKYLNTSSGQSVSNLLQNVEDEVTITEDRVGELNTKLSGVDYRNGNYLQLVTEKTRHESIRQVESAMRRLRAIMLNEQDDEGDGQYKALSEVIRLIREAVENKRTLASQALLDPRHRLQFYVSEVNRESGARSGKRSGSQTGSGGEKEMMASFILTASLNYALSAPGAAKPRYATIVLDEAFSKSSPAAATRIIAALREFGLHPLFVTPNKEISLLKSHTRSAIIVHNKNKRATLTSLPWQEIENHVRRAPADS